MANKNPEAHETLNSALNPKTKALGLPYAMSTSRPARILNPNPKLPTGRLVKASNPLYLCKPKQERTQPETGMNLLNTKVQKL